MTACIFAIALATLPVLPQWFPAQLFKVNPDNMTVEEFGSQEFKVGKADDYQTVTLKGRHWAGSLYPPGEESTWDKWRGEDAFKAARQQLEKQGFKAVYLKADPGSAVDATLRKGDTYVELTLTNDAYSNSVAIIEPAAQGRALTLKPPAAQPETVSDTEDFPWLTPLAGAKLLDTRHDDGPLDVAGPNDTEPRLVGTGTVSKMYEGPPNVSALDFASTYEKALRAAGWTVVDASGAVVAHYAKSGRDVWARLYQEGADRWEIVVADTSAGISAALDKGCKVALYGITFDFDKASLKAESEPVLKQVLAAMRGSETAFEIGGHTDNVGDKAYNANLSQQRADAVKAWLVKHGIAAGRLTTKGYGDGQPVKPNDTPANRARNRRVELKKAGC